jgi:hypothetical protein
VIDAEAGRVQDSESSPFFDRHLAIGLASAIEVSTARSAAEFRARLAPARTDATRRVARITQDIVFPTR